MNSLLSEYNKTRPKEIHRKIRSLNHIHFWKGTEFHTFLCYVGCVLLKDFLCEEQYVHFLKLMCAASICLTDQYKAFLPKARSLFEEFIEESKDIYGSHSVTSNIHNLCHIVDEVERFGELNSISAYEFENELHSIKMRIKLCNKPLQQISRRLSETSYKSALLDLDNHNNFPQLNDKYVLPGSQNLIVYKKIQFRDFVLSEKLGDNYFSTKNGDIVILEYAIMIENKILVRGSRLKMRNNFFVRPFSSSYLSIYLSDNSKFDSEFFDISLIKAKLFSLPFKNQYVHFPLLHTIQ